MDPQTTWEELLAAYADGEWEVMEERATDLLQWLDSGGFPPNVFSRPNIGPDLNRAVARTACLFVLALLKEQWRPQA